MPLCVQGDFVCILSTYGHIYIHGSKGKATLYKIVREYFIPILDVRAMLALQINTFWW